MFIREIAINKSKNEGKKINKNSALSTYVLDMAVLKILLFQAAVQNQCSKMQNARPFRRISSADRKEAIDSAYVNNWRGKEI